MSGVTLKPVLGCNMGCIGCYEGDIFKANGNKPDPYNLDKHIQSALAGPPGPAVLHGGEITLMPLADLEKLLAALAPTRSISMQTNGSMLRTKILELLSKYAVYLGVSLNGPGVLNRDRRAAPVGVSSSDEATDKLTALIFKNIERARLEYNIPVSIITVLSSTNAGDDARLGRLVEWANDWGERLGIWDWRWNMMHEEDDGHEIELAPDRASQVYTQLTDATFADERRRWLPFREFVGNLTGSTLQPCWMGECDPYSTAAVWAVLGDGSVGNCLRTAKDGVPYLRAEDGTHSYRQDILKELPFADGGCGGCEWWDYCHGACPAEGEKGDWRNKSRFCKMYMDTYAHISARIKGIQPDWKRTER